METRAYTMKFATLCVTMFLHSGLVAAKENLLSIPKSTAHQIATTDQAGASGSTLQFSEAPIFYTMAKADKPSAQEVCEERCRKAYRRCYSQGNRPGTPEVQGGAPCSEQKQTCLRACAG